MDPLHGMDVKVAKVKQTLSEFRACVHLTCADYISLCVLLLLIFLICFFLHCRKLYLLYIGLHKLGGN